MAKMKKHLTVYPGDWTAEQLGGASAPRFNVALQAWASLMAETPDRYEDFTDPEWDQFFQLIKDHPPAGGVWRVQDFLLRLANLRGFTALERRLGRLTDAEVWKLIFKRGIIQGERS